MGSNTVSLGSANCAQIYLSACTFKADIVFPWEDGRFNLDRSQWSCNAQYSSRTRPYTTEKLRWHTGTYYIFQGGNSILSTNRKTNCRQRQYQQSWNCPAGDIGQEWLPLVSAQLWTNFDALPLRHSMFQSWSAEHRGPRKSTYSIVSGSESLIVKHQYSIDRCDQFSTSLSEPILYIW